MINKTFEEVAAMWLADKQQYVKMSTYCAYSLLLSNHLKPVFAKEQDVTEELVQTFVLGKLQQGLSRNSVKDMLMVLKMVLKYAAKHGYPVWSFGRQSRYIRFCRLPYRWERQIL